MPLSLHKYNYNLVITVPLKICATLKNLEVSCFISVSDQSSIPERILSAVIMGIRSFSTLAPSTMKLSARAEILNACADGLVSRLARNWVSVTTSTSLLWFTRLSEQLASVKLNLCSEREGNEIIYEPIKYQFAHAYITKQCCQGVLIIVQGCQLCMENILMRYGHLLSLWHSISLWPSISSDLSLSTDLHCTQRLLYSQNGINNNNVHPFFLQITFSHFK